MTQGQLIDVGERVAWTFIQTFLGSLLASYLVDGLGLDWKEALSIAVGAGLASVVKNLGAIKIGDTNSPQAMPGGTYGYADPDQG